MQRKILNAIARMFDCKVMENSLRGMYVEVMVAELLGSGWRHVGEDWSGWDVEHDDGTRVEVKQSALLQRWGKAKSPARLAINVASGHWQYGATYKQNETNKRLAGFYIFAWHDGEDQRAPEQWEFFVVPSSQLPEQKSIGLTSLRNHWNSVASTQLRREMERVANTV